MRSHSVTYSRQAALPDWLAILQHELPGGGRDGRLDLLVPSALLDELAAVLTGALLGHGLLYPAHWQSLLQEFERTRQAFGQQLKTQAGPLLTGLLAELDPTQAPPKLRASQLQRELRAVREGLRGSDLRQAAWDDALAAFRTGADPEEAGIRLRLLWDLVEHAEGDWKRISSTLAGALNDDLFALGQMGHQLPRRPEDLHDEAGWTLPRRLEACREYLAAPAPRGRLTAWVAFDHAFLSQLYLRIGPAELWAGHAYPDALADSNWREGGPPAELAGEAHELFLPEPSGEPWVLMRLDLGERPSAGATEHARSLALTVVQMAAIGSSWDLMPGCALVREGRWYGSGINRVHPGAHRRDPRHEHTDASLTRLDPALVEGLVARLPEVEDVAADVRWAESVRGLPDAAQRVALAVRLLERRLPDAGGTQPGWGRSNSWTARTRWWLRENWAYARLFEDLLDAAFEGVYNIRDRWLAPYERFLHYEELMLPSTGGLGYEMRPQEVMRGLRQLADELPAWSMSTLIVGWTADQVVNGEAAARRLDAHAACFDVLLRRAHRVRNAVLHGNNTSPAVVATVEPLLSGLTNDVIGAQLSALKRDSSTVVELEDVRRRRLEELDLLRGGAQPGHVLFGGTGG